MNQILHAGEIEAENTDNNINPYAVYFDNECIMKLGILIKIIKESPNVNAWRHKPKGGASIEDTVKALLVKIKEVADTFKTDNARLVSQNINKIMLQCYDKNVYLASREYIAKFLETVIKTRNITYYQQYKTLRGRNMALDSSMDVLPELQNLDIQTFVNMQQQNEFKKRLFADLMQKYKGNICISNCIFML